MPRSEAWKLMTPLMREIDGRRTASICASRDPSPRIAETDDSVVFNSQRPHEDSRNLIILKVGPKESPSGSGYTT
jgi:hypothetical protein